MKEVEVETVYLVHSPDGWRYEVGPDRDGLGCLEIRYIEGEKEQSHFTLSVEMAEAVASCLVRVVQDLKERA